MKELQGFILLIIIGCILMVITHPLFWVAGVIVILVAVAMNTSTKSTSNTKITYKPKNAKEIDIDQKISVEDYKKTKEILNSIDLERISFKTELYKIIDQLAVIGNSEFKEDVKQVDFNTLKASLIEMRDSINKLNLDSTTAISTREMYQGTLTDEQMEEAEVKVNGIDTEEIDDEELYEEDEVLEAGFIAGVADTLSDSKNNRIKKKREQLKKLQREHGFQRGYLPFWDSEEHLYDKETDEEKYLDGKILELKEKNLSHDMYMTEDEKRIYNDDSDNGMW
ncbi:MAG: hypothetical protein NC390_00475 [Fusobacterium sp.]|nr:hypothetical protein [Fusobacterium sp.]